MKQSQRADEISATLQLQPHPEGGAFREIFRSEEHVEHPASGDMRNACTSIYFLLRAGEFSSFHRVASDEVWCLLEGGPLELHMVSPGGETQKLVLGTSMRMGEQPQGVVPANWLQAACPVPGAQYALCACIVAPGFAFDDFELSDPRDLLKRFPGARELILRFTR